MRVKVDALFVDGFVAPPHAILLTPALAHAHASQYDDASTADLEAIRVGAAHAERLEGSQNEYFKARDLIETHSTTTFPASSSLSVEEGPKPKPTPTRQWKAALELTYLNKAAVLIKQGKSTRVLENAREQQESPDSAIDAELKKLAATEKAGEEMKLAALRRMYARKPVAMTPATQDDLVLEISLR
ncbi:hypothetical protein RQP46_009773 [Phenoliferia psychrophenolica]